jgi:hypothetical protein
MMAYFIYRVDAIRGGYAMVVRVDDKDDATVFQFVA